MSQSKFLRVRCPRCKKFQITFGKSSTSVKCKGCNKPLNKPAGGKTKIKASIEEIFHH